MPYWHPAFAEGPAAIASSVEHSGPAIAQFAPGNIQNRVRFETKRRPHASSPRASNLLRDRPGNARTINGSERRTIMNRTFMLAIALVALPTSGLTVLDAQAQSVPAA
jgi:hypothetical protein